MYKNSAILNKLKNIELINILDENGVYNIVSDIEKKVKDKGNK